MGQAQEPQELVTPMVEMALLEPLLYELKPEEATVRVPAGIPLITATLETAEAPVAQLPEDELLDTSLLRSRNELGLTTKNPRLPELALGVRVQRRMLRRVLPLGVNQPSTMREDGKTAGRFWLAMCLDGSKNHETDSVANQQQRHHFDRRARHRSGRAILRSRRHPGRQTQRRAHRSVKEERWPSLRLPAPQFGVKTTTTMKLHQIHGLDQPWHELPGHRAMRVRKDQTLLRARSSRSQPEVSREPRTNHRPGGSLP